MASGTPVITSNISSLPEVGGDATVYINPYETEEIFRAMKKILLDKSFAFNMISRGLIQSRKFTWEKTVTETMALYYK
jgi:glycosyltransferase involved in cell wall biosynthesis